MELHSVSIALWHALKMAFFMGWEIFWALVLGFTLSAIVQAVSPKKGMQKLLPDSSPRSLFIACGLGAASSSCSYAAVALTRAIIRKGADFVAAMGFQMASTNLVIELGILLLLLLGWQFLVAELIGGLLLVFIMAYLFRIFIAKKSIDAAKQQADLGLSGQMEGHAHMDMAITEGSIWQRIFSRQGMTIISHYFIMDWAAIWKDIVVGLLLAGALAAWVPNHIWGSLFVQTHPVITQLWGPIVGPLIAIFSFVCSVGNVPLAAVLWSGGISFGGVLAFIYADLIILPIVNIYRKYYGFKMAMIIFVIYYIAMVLAAIIVDAVFATLKILPLHRGQNIFTEMSLYWNYTAILNIIFGVIAIGLLVRFFMTGGPQMLRMMDEHKTSHHH